MGQLLQHPRGAPEERARLTCESEGGGRPQSLSLAYKSLPKTSILVPLGLGRGASRRCIPVEHQ